MERSKLRITKAFLSLMAFFLLACSTPAQQQEENYRLLNSADFETALNSEETPQLIDVRTPGEFQAGSIEGAVNYNLLDGSFEAAIAELDASRPVFVYCAKGGRSGKAAGLLKEKGFKVIDLEGGYSDWPY